MVIVKNNFGMGYGFRNQYELCLVLEKGEGVKVEEFKIWKGINTENPVWASRGFCGTHQSMIELMEYLKHNVPSLVLRVVPYHD